MSVTRLHWLRVRRARGERPAPIPKPKRPLGPPMLFAFKDVSIRTRADVLAAWGTWDEFMDDVSACVVDDPFYEAQLPHLIERLVPPADLQAHREDVARRGRERDEERARLFANEQHRRAKAAQKVIQLQSIVDRWMGRAA